jgi:hypothetical protein
VSALSVHLNRSKPREVDAPASFSARQAFDVALENHGDSSTVHVQLDETLSTVAHLAEREQRVAESATEHIHVTVDAVEAPVTGELSISLGYGTSTAKTSVTVEPPEREEYDISVDESLGTPQKSTGTSMPDIRVLALVGLAGAALSAAVAVALAVKSAVVVGAAVAVAIVAVGGMILALD